MIRVPSETPLPCDMVGALKTYPVSVSVENLVLWIMLSLVATVGFPCFATMNSEILLLHFSLTEVCTNVAVEPPLQELSGEDEGEELSGATANKGSGAWLDIVVALSPGSFARSS